MAIKISFFISQGATEGDDEPTEGDKEPTFCGPQNGVEKLQDNAATENPTATQKTKEKEDRPQKSNFGGFKKGFLL